MTVMSNKRERIATAVSLRTTSNAASLLSGMIREEWTPASECALVTAHNCLAGMGLSTDGNAVVHAAKAMGLPGDGTM